MSDAPPGFAVVDPRFAHYVLDNAPLEELASGFRWIEGPVWFGDANHLLFQDLPNDRTMRWIEHAGVSVYPRAVVVRQRAGARPRGAPRRVQPSRPLPVPHRARRHA